MRSTSQENSEHTQTIRKLVGGWGMEPKES
jgi:hypothetical protein